MAVQPVRWASVGLGGYAGAMCEWFLKATDEATPPIRLEAVCEPAMELHAEKIKALRDRGIKVFADYDQLLAEPVEAVWLPLPIDLHRPFTEKAAAAGKAVICEKPAAGSVDDLHAMMAARDRHRVPVAIAFQDIYDDATLEVKRRLVGGAIGKIRHATLHACWPRGANYYSRNAWAGKFKRNNTWVMDSPANNALAHFINLAMFFLGSTERAMGEPTAVAAELYRVNPIENYDTCSLRVEINGQIPLLIHLTHAGEQPIEPTIHITGERGNVLWRMNEPGVLNVDGKSQPLPANGDTRGQMIHKIARWLRGDSSTLVVSLEMAKAHLAVVNGASEATAVRRIGDEHVKSKKTNGDTIRMLPGIETVFEQASLQNQMLHETGAFPWTVAGGSKDLRGYHHFNGPAAETP